jgi:hypothetical protein
MIGIFLRKCQQLMKWSELPDKMNDLMKSSLTSKWYIIKVICLRTFASDDDNEQVNLGQGYLTY